MTAIHHRTATVDGLEVFYREAGSPQLPTVVLLHGFPTSSHMFRNLIPLLADRYHVIAPDHIGFGRSSAPAVGEFPYTFDALTEVHEQLLAQLDVRRYALYVQDYGAPIGWRLALHHPDRVTAIISQNGNAYTEGFVDAFWAGLFAYAADPSNPGKEAAVRGALTVEKTRWQYENGVPDLSLIDPDAWTHAQSGLDRPGNDEIQLALFRDYASNPPLYRACRSTSAPARSRCWPSGVATTRFSAPAAPPPSRGTCPTPRCTCWTAVTSPWRTSSTPPPTTSTDSSTACSPTRTRPRAGRKQVRSVPGRLEPVDGEVGCTRRRAHDRLGRASRSSRWGTRSTSEPRRGGGWTRATITASG